MQRKPTTMSKDATDADRRLDQCLIKVDAESYQRYRDILDRPPSGEGFRRLMNALKPWEA